ncbi:DUF58 domain-containing protein [Luteibaculum oceani]|uniref:DUF58 domain-containing protein n=1 Tax=Luteibaculum oceani TaxID=1294296 RepID=A0A5C6USF9_9FLAO|nr:DUF58 domain-containing protein [Luteibaculum oceani]TXC76177.1 DUF58 domain-containing protein [Luteibaculum oceani]
MQKESTSEILKKVRRIELKTRGLSNQIFSGQYHSAFKGRGMAFSEVREYMPGDEIRTIDWNVTARFNQPYVKIFEEERELTVILVVDVSASDNFGSKEKLKKNLITELCAVLSFSAIQNNDKIGVIFFSDKVEKFIPPKKGKSHILRIIRELIEFEPESKGTNISEALTFLNNAIKKRAIAFLISDFMDDHPFKDGLRLANQRHDLVALQIKDEREESLPNVGLLPVVNPETGEWQWMDSSSKKVRNAYKQEAARWNESLHKLFKKTGVDFVSLYPNRSYVAPLINLFKKRSLHA